MLERLMVAEQTDDEVRPVQIMLHFTRNYTAVQPSKTECITSVCISFQWSTNDSLVSGTPVTSESLLLISVDRSSGRGD